jgi:ankyrin repeat protein
LTNAQAVIKQIGHHARINARNRALKTPLYEAVAENHGEESGTVVRLLIANGADVNARMYYGSTPLIGAAASGKLGAVEALLAGRATVDADDDMGETALHHVVARGRADIAEALLAAGADVNARTHADETPLQIARKGNRLTVVPVLLKHGARD